MEDFLFLFFIVLLSPSPRSNKKDMSTSHSSRPSLLPAPSTHLILPFLPSYPQPSCPEPVLIVQPGQGGHLPLHLRQGRRCRPPPAPPLPPPGPVRGPFRRRQRPRHGNSLSGREADRCVHHSSLCSSLCEGRQAGGDGQQAGHFRLGRGAGTGTGVAGSYSLK